MQSLLGPGRSDNAWRELGDDRILSTMAERVFAAGFVWRVIEQKWPGFEEAFLGFEPKRLLFQPDDFWHDLASDSRIVRNPQKIKSVRDNAAFVERVAKEHGGFGEFLANWPADDQVGLMAYLGKHGSRLGGNTGQYFLRWLGWDAFVLSERYGGGAARRRPRHRRKPDLEEGSRQDPGPDQPMGGGDGAAAPRIFRASWRCRSARTIRPKHCANIWAT